MYRDTIFGSQSKAKLASKIARIDPQRVNEAYSKGVLPNLPATRAGQERLYDVPHIVALRTYSEFLEQGLAKATAGAIASRAQQVLEADLHHEEPTLHWAVFYPHRADLGTVGVYQAVPFFTNDGFEPNVKHRLGPKLNYGNSSKGSGFYVSFDDHLRYILSKLRSACVRGED